MKIKWRNNTESVGENCWSPCYGQAVDGVMVNYFPDAGIITMRESRMICDDSGMAKFKCESFDEADFFVSRLITVHVV